MYTIKPRGPFNLAETINFAYIDREPQTSGEHLLLGFCHDGSLEPTAVAVSQLDDGTVKVHGDPGTRGQVERILGLDVDASTFADVGDRDQLIADLQHAASGLRPPQIHSAYEAAVFCILTARRSGAQARHMRTRLAEAAGTLLDVRGSRVTCLPPPAWLLDPPDLPGLDDTRRQRLIAVARAAHDGHLDTHELGAMEPEEARRHVENIPGIGPFSSAIIVVRSLGHTDYLASPVTELNRLVGKLYHLGHDATPDELERIADNWSPWRTWSQLYIRSAAERLDVMTPKRA
ncbi:DNA-3-methyladenine glycosylase family protein [Nocardioides marmoraquaticus]